MSLRGGRQFTGPRHQGGWMVIPMAISAVAAVAKGNAESAAKKGEANSAEYAGKVADLNAGMAYEQADRNEEQNRRQSRQDLGEQRASVAQSGTGFGGSNADVIRQSTTNAEMDALNIRYGGAVEAASYRNEGTASRYNAKLSRSAAKSAKTGGYLNATASIANSMSSYGGGMGGGG